MIWLQNLKKETDMNNIQFSSLNYNKILITVQCFIIWNNLIFINKLTNKYRFYLSVIRVDCIKIKQLQFVGMQAPPINEDEMEQLLEWIDTIPFSRPKRNIARDFADGVFVAEIMKMYRPQLVQLHNYPTVSSLSSKFANWKTLNDKVFRKMKFQVNQNDVNGIIASVPGCIERVLYMIYTKIKRLQQERLTSDFDSAEGKNVVLSAESKMNTQISAQLEEKEQTIQELRNTIQILQTKMRRMEELNRLKDAKIQSLIRKLEEGIN